MRSSESAQDASRSINASGELSFAENSNTSTAKLNGDNITLTQSGRHENKDAKHVTIMEIAEEDMSLLVEPVQDDGTPFKHNTATENEEEDSKD